jgi:zinc D-Ala-D-Ala carboxypeptidase
MKLRGLKFTNYTIFNLDFKYFKLSEFDSPDEPGSGSKMNYSFIEKLDYARGNAGVKFSINSGYRSKNWNEKVGGRVGVGKLMSSHCKGLAADIHCNNSRDRALIVQSLLNVGITRLGIADTFIHCDVDKDKDQDVIWLY